MHKKRIIVVVNKYWECDPVCNVLSSQYIRDNSQCPIDLYSKIKVNYLTYPSYGPVVIADASKTQPRIEFITDNYIIEIWCISDLLCNSGEALQSSSEEKMRLLPYIYAYNNEMVIDLVVAVGTASAGPSVGMSQGIEADNINGSVVVGTNVFMHNGYDKGSKSNYQCECWSQLLTAGSTDLIASIFNQYSSVESLFMTPPVNPSEKGIKVYWHKDYIALGDVNVTDYKKYGLKDKETGEDFFGKYPGNSKGVSLETTHCLIYKAAKDYMGQNPPFVFVSGVVDRYLQFKADVSTREYAQNIVGAHNAGIVVAWILSSLND